MPVSLAERIANECNQEQLRQGYPKGFPALPPTPVARYTDPEFYRLEQDAIFSKCWLFAGHVSDLPEIGSYKKIDRLKVPVFLIRSKDNQVRAFYNTCQHRGAPVVRGQEGCTSRLTCQYHAWTYDTFGKLIAVPHERDFCDLDKSSRNLKPIRCEVWQGFIYVNLDVEAESLAIFMNPLERELANQIDGPNLKMAIRRNQIVKCNWKIAQEAFLEAYHVPVIHPQTAARILDYSATSIGLLPNGHSRMVHKLNSIGSGSAYDIKPIPTAGPLLGSLSTAYGIFPNATVPVNAFMVPMINFWPIDIATTLIEWIVYAPKWDGDETPEGYAAFEKAFSRVMDEDYDNLGPMQASVASGALDEVPLCYQERRIYHFNLEVDKRIGRDRIPDSLRVREIDLWVEKAD